MALNVWPQAIQDGYELHEWHHASSILAVDFPNEFRDICEILAGFRLLRSHVTAAGGRKSPISTAIDSEFYRRGWIEHSFNTNVVVDGVTSPVPTHKVDCYRNGVAFEVEWNNKDPFFDRDLNNFRLLFELRTVGVGVILTRASHLDRIFRELGKYDSYGQSTTHMNKLLPRVQGGGAGGCPVIAIGITERIYVED